MRSIYGSTRFKLVVVVVSTFTCLISSACSQDIKEAEDYIHTYTQSFDNPEIRIAHWNIGHFSKGKAPYTLITSQETDSLKVEYKKYLSQAEIDILGICEYNSTFNTDGANTADCLFSDFQYSYIGRQYSYNCNTIFSNIPLHNCHLYHFPECIQHRYYSVADIIICGKVVKFIETHLDFNQDGKGNSYRLLQMQELVDAFYDSPYVIICADYNSSYREEYDVFRAAGYSFATDSLPNSGSTSSDTTRIIIDNILSKGFEIKNTRVFPHNSLSDHNMICTKLRLREDNSIEKIYL